MNAVDLAAAPRPRGDADRQFEARIALQQVARDGRLAGARGRRQHQHQPAAANARQRGIARPPCAYSRFCTCSRNWSTTAFSSSPMAVSDAAFDFEHSVFDSRLNSCARKSSLRPIGAAGGKQRARRKRHGSSAGRSPRGCRPWWPGRPPPCGAGVSSSHWRRPSAGAPARQAAGGWRRSRATDRLRLCSVSASMRVDMAEQAAAFSASPSAAARLFEPGQRGVEGGKDGGVEGGAQLVALGRLRHVEHAAQRRAGRRRWPARRRTVRAAAAASPARSFRKASLTTGCACRPACHDASASPGNCRAKSASAPPGAPAARGARSPAAAAAAPRRPCR